MPASSVRSERPTNSRSPDAEHVAAVERRRRVEMRERPMTRQSRRHRDGLAAPRLRARPRDHRHLVEHDRRVLDEHRVGQLGLDGQPLDRAPELREQRLVGSVLPLGELDVDRFASEVRELAPREGGAHAPRDGDPPPLLAWHGFILARRRHDFGGRTRCSSGQLVLTPGDVDLRPPRRGFEDDAPISAPVDAVRAWRPAAWRRCAPARG